MSTINTQRLKLVIAALAAVLFLLWAAPDASAKVYIDINAPAGKRLPIAVQEIAPIGAHTAGMDEFNWYKKELDSALSGDLEFTQIFDLIEKEAFLEDIATSGLTRELTDFYQWRAIGAEMLVKGGVTIEGTLITVEFRLFDTVREKQLLARRYAGRADNIREMAHRFSSAVLEKLTGESGPFLTRLAFVSDKTGSKEIYVSDYDGENLRQVTSNKSINLSPQWSPDRKKLIYVSYKRGTPALYTVYLKNMRSYSISEKPGLNISGRYAPDGRRIALTVSSKKSPELFVLNINTLSYTQLTDNYGIDVSPTWSPDGERIAYVSDSAGNPHIYVIDSKGGKSKRLTRQGKYSADPAWSPDGRQIAYSRDSGGGFKIWVMKPDGSAQRRVSSGRDDKTPSWSPGGRHIIFSSKDNSGKRSLYIMRSDGSGSRKFDPTTGNETDPAWSP